MDVKRWSIVMVKALAASVLVTAAGIALFSALAYFFRLDDGMINAGVVVLHILSCFAADFWQEREYGRKSICGDFWLEFCIYCAADHFPYFDR